jgi:Guanosine polyphosphate pyrophosphohydrolases/synthetases
MKIENLMEVLPDIYSVVDRELIMRAYQFAEQAHSGQRRASGEPYITHCVAVAAILAEMRVPPAVIIAGLLHDIVEDTNRTLADIRREFGDEVAHLVDGVTKLTNLPRVERGDQHLEEKDEPNGNGDDPLVVIESDPRGRKGFAQRDSA